MPRIRRTAAERADASRRCSDNRERRVQLNEKSGNVPTIVQIPLLQSASIPPGQENTLQFHMESWNCDIMLKPFLGVTFFYVDRKERFGMIKHIIGDSLKVFLLYNKATMQEVFEKLSMNNDKRNSNFLDGISPHECFQSTYTDVVPISDVFRVFNVTYPSISLTPGPPSIQRVCVVGWIFFEALQRKEHCHIQFFKSFRLSSTMLNSYFDNFASAYDFFKVTNVLGVHSIGFSTGFVCTRLARLYRGKIEFYRVRGFLYY